uniref:Uncharacterized protein n=1 Tax=Fagus sylvatica TaxID=28930 RepID=A0A2N9FN13_FAGSY
MCRIIIDRIDPKTCLSARNNEGETPLFKAVLHGKKEAFLYFHSICGPREGYNYFTRTDGETILHRAISEEYFELSLSILRMYSDLVCLADKDGKSPLHVLASKPSAFKSGSDLSWFEKIIYHAIATTDEQELKEEEKYLERQEGFHGGEKSCEPVMTFGSTNMTIEASTGERRRWGVVAGIDLWSQQWLGFALWWRMVLAALLFFLGSSKW